MEVLSLPSTSTSITISLNLPIKPQKTYLQTSLTTLNFCASYAKKTRSTYSLFSSPFNTKLAAEKSLNLSASTTTTPFTSNSFSSTETDRRHWMVLMKSPPEGLETKPEIVNYYVKTLERVLGRRVWFKCCVFDSFYCFFLGSVFEVCFVCGFVQ